MQLQNLKIILKHIPNLILDFGNKWRHKMENRIYYGEYSLKHWIELLLKKQITLPEYQRSYVWDENAVKRFIKSLKDKQFIPPSNNCPL